MAIFNCYVSSPELPVNKWGDIPKRHELEDISMGKIWKNELCLADLADLLHLLTPPTFWANFAAIQWYIGKRGYTLVNRSTTLIPIIYHIIPYKKRLHCARGCRFSSDWLAEFRMAVVHNVGGLNFMVPSRETRSGLWNGPEKLEQQQNFQRYQNPTVWFNTFQNIIV